MILQSVFYSRHRSHSVNLYMQTKQTIRFPTKTGGICPLCPINSPLFLLNAKDKDVLLNLIPFVFSNNSKVCEDNSAVDRWGFKVFNFGKKPGNRKSHSTCQAMGRTRETRHYSLSRHKRSKKNLDISHHSFASKFLASIEWLMIGSYNPFSLSHYRVLVLNRFFLKCIFYYIFLV